MAYELTVKYEVTKQVIVSNFDDARWSVDNVRDFIQNDRYKNTFKVNKTETGPIEIVSINRVWDKPEKQV